MRKGFARKARKVTLMAANMMSQQVLPLPVQQVAANYRMGTFVKIYTSTLTRTILGAGLFMAVGAAFLVGGTLPDDITVSTRVILIIFGLLFVGQASYMAYLVAQAIHQQIYLFQQGLIIGNGNQMQPFPWSQAAEVWQSVTRRYQNGVYVGTTYIYTLHRTDGYKIKLGNLTKGIAELGPAIAQGVSQELVPRARYALRSGQTLPFTPFSVNQQGISNGREFIPWPQVQTIDVKQGRVIVKKVGAKGNWGSTTVAKMPNFLVFIVVTKDLMRQSSKS